MNFKEFLLLEAKMKPEDLAKMLAPVRDAKGLDAKKDAARAVVNNMAFKDKTEKHLQSIERISNPNEIDTFMYNLVLRGEGLGVTK